MEFIISCVGFILLWVATDVGRKEVDKIVFFRSKWFVIFALITIGVLLIKNAHNFN